MDPDTFTRAVTLAGQVLAYPHTPGVVGSVLAMRWAGCGLWEKLFAIGFGLACALWAAPALVDFVGMQTETVPRLASLFAGAYGARVGDQIAEAVKRLDFGALLGAVIGRLPWGQRK